MTSVLVYKLREVWDYGSFVYFYETCAWFIEGTQ